LAADLANSEVKQLISHIFQQTRMMTLSIQAQELPTELLYYAGSEDSSTNKKVTISTTYDIASRLRISPFDLFTNS